MGRVAETLTATEIGTVAEHKLFELFEYDPLNIFKIFLSRDMIRPTRHMSIWD